MPAGRRERVEELARLQSAGAAMARTWHATRRRRGVLAAVLDARGIGNWQHAPAYLRGVAFACRLCRSEGSHTAFARLIRHLDAHAGRLLHRGCGAYTCVVPLQHVAEQHALWERAPESWHPRGKCPTEQFARLVRYLFGSRQPSLPVEQLFTGEIPDAARPWFIRLTKGEATLSGTEAPAPLTRRMAYQFLEAWKRSDAIRALRAAQVRGLGGSESLVRAVIHSRLGWQLCEREEEDWWATVLQWLAGHPELDAAHVVPIVELCHSRRYGEADGSAVPDPGFSLTGRSSDALWRLVEAWHKDRIARQILEPHALQPSGIREGRWVVPQEEQRIVWTVEEILDRDAVVEEGRAMHHCVALYGVSAARGRCSLWSIKRSCGGVTRRALTLRVRHPTRELVECRGSCNRRPKPAERQIVELWARENDVTLRL